MHPWFTFFALTSFAFVLVSARNFKILTDQDETSFVPNPLTFDEQYMQIRNVGEQLLLPRRVYRHGARRAPGLISARMLPPIHPVTLSNSEYYEIPDEQRILDEWLIPQQRYRTRTYLRARSINENACRYGFIRPIDFLRQLPPSLRCFQSFYDLFGYGFPSAKPQGNAHTTKPTASLTPGSVMAVAPTEDSEEPLPPTVSEPVSAPVSEPASAPVSEPASDPAISEPASDPAIAEPASDPAISEPASDPAISEPASDPAIAEPASDPAIAEPASDPAIAEPASDPVPETKTPDS